jgi:hypothetical protein
VPPNGAIGVGSAVGAWGDGGADAVSAVRLAIVDFAVLRDAVVGDDCAWRAGSVAKAALARIDAGGTVAPAGPVGAGVTLPLPGVVPLAASAAITCANGVAAGVPAAADDTVSLPDGSTAVWPGSDTDSAIGPGMQAFSSAHGEQEACHPDNHVASAYRHAFRRPTRQLVPGDLCRLVIRHLFCRVAHASGL